MGGREEGGRAPTSPPPHPPEWDNQGGVGGWGVAMWELSTPIPLQAELFTPFRPLLKTQHNSPQIKSPRFTLCCLPIMAFYLLFKNTLLG